MLSEQFLKVKLAGGAAAQCLALMNAIYLHTKLKRNFKLYYFPHSTGTYWPFAIKFLLEPSELGSSECLIKGLEINGDFEVGKVIQSHPLSAKTISYEKLLLHIRKLKLERVLQGIRGESALLASYQNLQKVNRRTRAVSGGFVPILNPAVNSEMNRRFKRAGRKSPFSLSMQKNLRPDVVIHFRIGDKRTSFSDPTNFGGDGICDPSQFKDLVKDNLSINGQNIYVVSDEPQVAAKLLHEVGLDVKLNVIKGDIWEDLYLMSQAKLFIGSWSQVSQLAAICVTANGGHAILPSTTLAGTKVTWEIPTVNFYKPRFLEKNHSIYSDNFELDEDAHKSYTGINLEPH